MNISTFIKRWKVFSLAPWSWVLAAFLVAGTRITELGLSLDPALFASIARNFSRNWDWWNLGASPNLFPQYWEHPYLHLWLQGIVFHFFGATDITTRLVGLVLGSGTFYFLYRLGEKLVDHNFAEVLCFLTLLSVYFTGRIPSLYHEVPLVFFMVASLYYFLEALDGKPLLNGTVSGILLGLAFLSKGLAAAPMVASIGLVALYRIRLRTFYSLAVWFWFCGCATVVGLFCLLQSHFGDYSFVREYLGVSLFRKTLAPGTNYFSMPFILKLMETHGIHVLMAVGALVGFKKLGLPKEAVIIGGITSVMFLLATASLGRNFLHYYYPLYPFINILSAAFCYPLTRKTSRIRLYRLAIGLALVYQSLWNFLPVHMRNIGLVDYFELTPSVKALKNSGVALLESLHIPWQDWGYREMSLWYWDMDTRLEETPESITNTAVILPRDQLESIRKLEIRNFVLCARSSYYAIYVNLPTLRDVCNSAFLSREMLR